MASKQYLCTRPALPAEASSPVMTAREMTTWLNTMARDGWEFVGYGATWWHQSDTPQDWWIFSKSTRWAPRARKA
jgi:hypothetical protein